MTPQLQRTLTTIREFIAANGIAPSIREIMQIENLKSTQGVCNRVNRLIELGYLVRLHGGRRNIALPGINLTPVPTDALRAELARREGAARG